MSTNKIIITFFIFLLGGCSNLQITPPKYPWSSGKDICVKECNKEQAIDAFVTANKYCQQVYSFYESTGTRLGSANFMLASIGALSGAVISPITSGTASQAWAGLSGATNAMQSSVRENFEGTISIKRTGQIQETVEKHFIDINNENDNHKIIMSSVKLATLCSMAPANADMNTLSAISGESNTTDDKKLIQAMVEKQLLDIKIKELEEKQKAQQRAQQEAISIASQEPAGQSDTTTAKPPPK